eukprot:scaffold17789_cov112-Isochrysis_galbana.AAC.6
MAVVTARGSEVAKSAPDRMSPPPMPSSGRRGSAKNRAAQQAAKTGWRARMGWAVGAASVRWPLNWAMQPKKPDKTQDRNSSPHCCMLRWRRSRPEEGPPHAASMASRAVRHQPDPAERVARGREQQRGGPRGGLGGEPAAAGCVVQHGRHRHPDKRQQAAGPRASARDGPDAKTEDWHEQVHRGEEDLSLDGLRRGGQEGKPAGSRPCGARRAIGARRDVGGPPARGLAGGHGTRAAGDDPEADACHSDYRQLLARRAQQEAHDDRVGPKQRGRRQQQCPRPAGATRRRYACSRQLGGIAADLVAGWRRPRRAGAIGRLSADSGRQDGVTHASVERVHLHPE